MKPGPRNESAAPGGRPSAALTAGLIEALRPRAGQRFLDAACGPGGLFFPVFEAMGGRGVFLAAEWEEEGLRRFLNRLETYADHPGYTRVEVVRAKPERLPLPDGCVDLALLSRDASASPLGPALRELRRLLAPGGTLCLLGSQKPAGVDGGDGSEHAASLGLAAEGFEWRVSHAGPSGRWCLTARL